MTTRNYTGQVYVSQTTARSDSSQTMGITDSPVWGGSDQKNIQISTTGSQLRQVTTPNIDYRVNPLAQSSSTATSTGTSTEAFQSRPTTPSSVTKDKAYNSEEMGGYNDYDEDDFKKWPDNNSAKDDEYYKDDKEEEDDYWDDNDGNEDIWGDDDDKEDLATWNLPEKEGKKGKGEALQDEFGNMQCEELFLNV